MRQGLSRLTVETIDDVLAQVVDGRISRIDLRGARFVDPYALLLLELLVLEAIERGSTPRIDWPGTPVVRRWMTAMGFFANIGMAPKTGSSAGDRQSALQPITAISDEEGIGRVVDGFHQRLANRYPLPEASRRTLTAMMIELFQNIPHHSNATGEIGNPHGIAAMQDYKESIFLAIADKGIGLRGSLGLRLGYEKITDVQALDAISRKGLSRFADAGRGGELQRIIGIVRSWDVTFALRSGAALLYFDEHRGDIYDVPDFPGVQLAIQIPLRLFDTEMVDP